MGPRRKVSEDGRRIVEQARTIAVLGMKGDEEPAAAAHQVPKYLERHGYEVVPVNPKLADSGYPGAVAHLSDLDEPPDVVQVFRRAEWIDAHVPELIELHPGAVWFQLGIRNDPAAEALRAAGIPVVQDECMYQTHRAMVRDHQRSGAAESVSR